jgi:branched-chain amino acid transport system ATP-binding protein
MRLVVEDLCAGYGSTQILSNVGLTVDSGQSLGIVGRNGMGKTTLARAVLGYLPRRSGSVRLDESEVSGMRTHHVVRLGVGYCPQEENVFSELSVSENLLGAIGRVDPTTRDRVFALFPILAERLKQAAGTLSGGERKMLVLARALLSRPSVLIIDEISDGLQPSIIEAVVRALLDERSERGTTMLIIEQNLSMTLRVADDVCVLKRGQVVLTREAGALGVREELADQLAP